ncbi:hypothetical protein ACFLYC_02085 [Chloroflexota bacterium]
MSEPSASTQLPVLPSVGMLTLDYLASSGSAATGVGEEIETSRLNSRNSPTASFIFVIWRILVWPYGKSQLGDIFNFSLRGEVGAFWKKKSPPEFGGLSEYLRCYLSS